jgi:hypothetical protein
VQQPARSQFIDGEIALMLGMRCVVSDRPDYRTCLVERIRIIIDRMESSPTLSAESYPDECWTFCNSVALAAIRVSDYLEGTDHRTLFRRWVAMSRAKLVDGRRIYSPEGSSIWMVCHCLSLIDEPFAREQYELARKALTGRVLGFGFAREWPSDAQEAMDVDSGLVVPIVQASVGSSGLAFVAAGTFQDIELMQSIATSLRLIGFPVEDEHGLSHAASNQVGDAVVLYGLVLGPMWEKVKGGRP